MKPETIQAFNDSQSEEEIKICDKLRREIDRNLPEAESKIWHAHKDASARFTDADQINVKDLKRWLGKAKTIQWDYRNIQKREGKLLRTS